MAEGSVGTGHHMFVVDSQANFVSTPSTKKPRWSRVGQKLLLMLVALALLGLVVEGFFIYKLYKQNESYNLCQKMSTPKTSAQQGGTIMGRVGPEDSKEFVTVQPRQQEIQHRPFAHLMGPNSVGEKNVVQWVNDVGEAITYNMSYNNGRLSVIKDGYYYLYSKVELNAAEECSLIQHKVWKDTMAYEKSIALMISNSFRCRTSKQSAKGDGEDLWQSFLAGIFHLHSGDQIFVTLENMKKMRPGPNENFMGAFMIFP